jgi:hypothetical protein
MEDSERRFCKSNSINKLRTVPGKFCSVKGVKVRRILQRNPVKVRVHLRVHYHKRRPDSTKMYGRINL